VTPPRPRRGLLLAVCVADERVGQIGAVVESFIGILPSRMPQDAVVSAQPITRYSRSPISCLRESHLGLASH